MTVTGSSKAKYQLDAKPLSDGGEGTIYRVLGGTGKKVAKIYKHGVLTKELVEKLALMLKVPPDKNVLTQVAWPLDLLYDTSRRPCGFLMPMLKINAELGDVYKYNPGDTKKSLQISIQQKLIVAQNICAVISAVHNAGYVFGDFNPRNIALDMHTGTVAFLDTDSYHVADKTSNKVYRCNVCAPGYAAPELLYACSKHMSRNPSDKNNIYAKTPLPTFTKETDYFALAIHIFKLLVNGYTPFGGIPEKASVSQASPGTGDAPVRRDNYCFKPGYKHQSAAILPLDAFPQKIADLFTRAFVKGKTSPAQRPAAREWHSALGEFQKNLRQCADNPLHQYDNRNANCPYCEADKRYSASVGAPFIKQPKHPSPPPPQARRKQGIPPAPMPQRTPPAQTRAAHATVMQQPAVVRTAVLRPPASQTQAVNQPAASGSRAAQQSQAAANPQQVSTNPAAKNSIFNRLRNSSFVKKALSPQGRVVLSCIILSMIMTLLLNSGFLGCRQQAPNGTNAFSELYVRLVRDSHRPDNPDITYGTAFSSYFGNPSWSYFKSTAGLDVVEFSGDCIYQGAPVTARMQFIVDQRQEAFELAFLAFNEVPQSERTLIELINSAFAKLG